MGTFIVVSVLFSAVILIIKGIVTDHKKGRHICGGNCAGCHGVCSHSLNYGNVKHD